MSFLLKAMWLHSNNFDRKGGGLFIAGATVTMMGCTISNNNAVRTLCYAHLLISTSNILLTTENIYRFRVHLSPYLRAWVPMRSSLFRPECRFRFFFFVVLWTHSPHNLLLFDALFFNSHILFLTSVPNDFSGGELITLIINEIP